MRERTFQVFLLFSGSERGKSDLTVPGGKWDKSDVCLIETSFDVAGCWIGNCENTYNPIYTLGSTLNPFHQILLYNLFQSEEKNFSNKYFVIHFNLACS